jgi:hypothetical protein
LRTRARQRLFRLLASDGAGDSVSPIEQAVCNLYSSTKGQQAIRDITRAMIDKIGNLPLFPGILPDYAAPVSATAQKAEPPGDGTEDGITDSAAYGSANPSPRSI